MKTEIYNKEGQSSGTINLDDQLFDLKWNADLVHQVVRSMESNARQSNADTKGRGDVRGGGKKPWRQKGTGRARHGSSRSPIWVGGGVAHGPTSEKNYDKKINKKMKTKALFTLLSQKLRDKELIFIEDFNLSVPKTKIAKVCLEGLAAAGFEKINYQKGSRALLTTAKVDENILKSFSNVTAVKVEEVRNMNPLDVVKYKYVVITNPDESLKVLTARVK